MSSEWRECSIGDLVNIKHGFAFSGEHISKDHGKCVLVTPGNFEIGGGFKEGNAKYFHGLYPEEFVFAPGDLIVTMTDLSKTADTLGYSAKIPREGNKIYLHNQRVGKVIAKSSDANLDVLYWVMRHKDYRNFVVSTATGSTVRHTSPSRILAYSFLLPPPSQQQAIAHILGTLDDKIELNRRMNASLEALARALFQSWFVDFDPVRAKLDGREPVGLDSNTAALFPQYLDNSTLGIIPKGWQVNRISEVVEEVFDGPHATPQHVEEGPIFLGIKNLTGSALDLSDTRYISESDWPRWTKRVTPKPLDIVFSYEATLGFFALIPPGLRCCLGRRLALIRPRAEDGHSHFWFHQFIGPDFQRYLIQHSVQGATVDRRADSKCVTVPLA